MTGRERLTAVFRRQPVDRLAWTTLVDRATLGVVPPALSADHGMAFYRHLGCDILLLNGWGTPYNLRSPRLVWGDDVTIRHTTEGELGITEYRLGNRVLRSEYRGAHPVRYPVTTLADVELFTAMWEGARYVAEDDRETWAALNALIGDDGISVRFWGPSAIPLLLENHVGTEAFYYLLHDHPAAMDRLIRTIHERQQAAFAALAAGPWEVVMLVENTSTYYISPDLYRRYNGPQVRDYVRTIQAAGKVAIVHMCGHVRGLLDQFGATAMDGIHALTPPPTGDCPWEMALDYLGEETIIVGALDPALWVMGPVAGIGPALDRLMTDRLRRAHLVVGPMADGIPVEWERFAAIADWFSRQDR